MLKKLLSEKNEYFLQKYNKVNPLYLAEMEHIDKIVNGINLKGYYTHYQEPYFFFYRKLFLNIIFPY